MKKINSLPDGINQSIHQANLPSRDPYFHPFLLVKPRIDGTPLPPLLPQLELIMPQHVRNQLVQLRERDVLPDARPRPGAEDQHVLLHLHRMIAFEPAAGPEPVRILAEDGSVVVHDGAVHPDAVSPRDVDAAELHALRGHDAAHGQRDAGVHAEGLLDAGAEVGEFDGVGVSDREAELAGFGRVVDLLHEFGVDGWVLHEVVEDGAEGDGCRVGSGEPIL